MNIEIGQFELITYRWGICLYYDWRHIGWNSSEGFFICVMKHQQEII